MSLYTKRDLSVVRNYVSGVELDPKTAAEEFVVEGDFPFPSPTSPCTIDLSPLLEAPELARARYRDGMFDARFALVGTYEGGRKTVTQVGRTWDAFRPGAGVSFVPSAPWGDTPVALVPAVAGLSTNIVEAGSLASWASLHTLLGANPAGVPVDRALLTDLNRLQGGRVNTVRFVHRLAALFWHSVVSDGGRPVQVEIRSAARMVHLTGVGQMSAEIQQGLTGDQYVPWADAISSDKTVVCSVLYAAAAGKLSVVGGSNRTRFLKYWPTLGKNVWLNIDDASVCRGLTGLARVTVDPSMVWFTALRWCAKYSSVELFEEAVSFIGALLFSPCNGLVSMVDTSVCVALPESSMGPFAAAPILEPLLELGIGNAPKMPDLGLMVEKAVVMASMVGLLAWHDLYKIVGWYYRHGLTNTNDAAEYCRRFSRHSDQVGMWRILGKNLSQFVKGDLGRLWSRVSVVTDKRWALTTAWAARAMQWEEVLNRTDKLPASSNIYGTLMPLQLKRGSVNRGQWARVASVDSSRSLDHAFFGIACNTKSAEFKLMHTGGLHTTFSNLHMPVNYRQIPADYAFMKGVDMYGNDFEPVFTIKSERDYYHLTDESWPRFAYRWYIENVSDEIMQKALKYVALAAPPPPVPDTSGPNMDDAALDSDVSDMGSVSDIEEIHPLEDDVSIIPKDTPHGGGAPGFEIPKGLKEDSPLAEALRACRTPYERQSEKFMYGLRYESMLRAGVPLDLVSAYSTLRCLGMPAPGMATLEAELAQLKKPQAFDVLKEVPMTKRIMVLEHMIEEQLACLKACPPGSSFNELAKVLRGMYAMRNAMGNSFHLTAEDMWNGKNAGERRALGVKDARGFVVCADYDDLPPAAKGRIADEQTSKDLLYGGQPLACGFGARLGTARKVLRADPELGLDTVETLIRVTIDSALDAGLEPNRRELVELCGRANMVDSLISKLTAARQAQEQGFQEARREGEENTTTPEKVSSDTERPVSEESAPVSPVEEVVLSEATPVEVEKQTTKALGPSRLPQVGTERQQRRRVVSFPSVSSMKTAGLSIASLNPYAALADTILTPSPASECVDTQEAIVEAGPATVASHETVTVESAIQQEAVQDSPTLSSGAEHPAHSFGDMEDIGPIAEAHFKDHQAGTSG